jgi:predicted XRE-type DNA-binding protein
MSELRSNLREEFRDREYRQAYADESLNAYIATQIKVLREQRSLTQKELAALTGMAQPRIAVLEDVNYSSWSTNTLRRLAEAFDLRLSVKFETFSSLVSEIETLSREALQRDSFDDDVWFQKKDVQSAGSAIRYGSQPYLNAHADTKVLAMAAGQGSSSPRSGTTLISSESYDNG